VNGLVSFIALVAFLVIQFPCIAGANLGLPSRVHDANGFLNDSYRNDLERRLARFEVVTGQAIYIAFLDGEYNQSLVGIANDLFERERLENRGITGALLLLIATHDRNAAIAVSRNLRKRFSRSGTDAQIRRVLSFDRQSKEVALEYSLQVLLAGIGHWFYRFDPPSRELGNFADWLRSPMSEMIILPCAPFFGMMTGILLMALTSAGVLSWGARFIISAVSGCFVVLVLIFIVRQPVGILPGMFYYGLSMGFVTSGMVGALRSFWFPESFQGKKSNAWWSGPVHFYRG